MICGVVLTFLVVGIVVWRSTADSRLRRLDMMHDTFLMPFHPFRFHVYNMTAPNIVLV
jgi:hypothetical protein